MKSQDRRLIRLFSESYYGMIRDLKPQKWLFTPLYLSFMFLWSVDPFTVQRILSILVTTNNSMVGHLHDLYCEFHNHSYVSTQRQLWLVFTIAL